MPKTWSYRPRIINVLEPKPTGLAGSVWAIIISATLIMGLFAASFTYVYMHELKETDQTPKSIAHPIAHPLP